MIVNPTVFYICLTVLAITAMVGAYFKIVPADLVITLISAILGHSITVMAQQTVPVKPKEQMGHVTLSESDDHS